MSNTCTVTSILPVELEQVTGGAGKKPTAKPMRLDATNGALDCFASKLGIKPPTKTTNGTGVSCQRLEAIGKILPLGKR
ncbi:MAG: hypothetical protein H7138_20415 [Myxococcales bacterium]|nr:hypothetical protein [Myxococcales bacterium]